MPATALGQGLGTLCSPVKCHSTKPWKRNHGRVRGSQAASYLLLFHFDLRGHRDVGAADGKEEVFNMESDIARGVWVGRLRFPEASFLPQHSSFCSSSKGEPGGDPGWFENILWLDGPEWRLAISTAFQRSGDIYLHFRESEHLCSLVGSG